MTARLRAAKLARFEQIEAFRERIRIERPAYQIICREPERAEELRAAGFKARTWEDGR